MRLPNGNKAVVLTEKLSGYVLNPAHINGGSDKARVFRAILGITAEHEAFLRDALLDVAAMTEDAVYKGKTVVLGDYKGDRYEVRFTLQGPNGNRAEIISAWFYRIDENFPRLASCYVAM